MSGECAICAGHAAPVAARLEAWRDEHFILRHHPQPAPALGWFLLDLMRHAQGPGDFTAAEASAFGPVLKRCVAAVKATTLCDRVYCMAFGESALHFHMHLAPRWAKDGHTAAWKMADHYRAAILQPGAVEDAEIAQLVAAVGRLLNPAS